MKHSISIPVHITLHAYDRAKERLGWKKRTLDRMITTVVEKGLQHSEMKGNLHKWASEQFRAHKATDLRVYGEFCFFFKGSNLITVFDIPTNLKKYTHL